MIDTHVHTWRCRHATGTAAEYVAAAAARGVRMLGFAEHLPLPHDLLAEDPHAASYAMPESELPQYLSEVREAADSIAGGGVRVLAGVEADLHAGNEAHVRSLLTGLEVDFVMGSVHYVDGWAFDDPDRQDGYERWSADDLWERYFHDLTAAARSGVADVMAHPDLVKKFRCWPKRDPRELFAAFADAAAAAGIAVEVSTAGLRKPCAEIYPGDELLRMLRSRDVPVTIGSDAHRPEEIAYAYEQAVEALSRAGYRSAVVFVRRRMEEVGL
ncbi:MAG: histidinol-phosphatase HisJ family protein [Anaerosomatales bacterium]|nr:histidinol-phosphatase HisJ family protein [Anaerosomatales bacterium]